VKVKFPLTYHYLNIYRRELEGRSIHKLWGKGNPFYSVYGIGSYTFAPYKVVWRRIAGAITGKAVSFACAVVGPLSGKSIGTKTTIPDDGIIMIGFDDPNEAYYMGGILNSLPVKAIIASYTYELRQETHIVDFVKVPKYDSKNNLHNMIAELSRRAHELAAPRACEELRKVEDELDRAMAELYGIPEYALADFRNLLEILSGDG
jgi:hypothetical protein